MKISVKIDRLQNNPNSALKAFASVTLDGMFAVHGLRVMESAKGRFVNMPSNSYKDKNGDTKYSDVFHAITKPARDAVSAAVQVVAKVEIVRKHWIFRLFYDML